MKNKSFYKAGALWPKKTKKDENYLQGFIQFETDSKYGMSQEDKEALIKALTDGEKLFVSIFKTTKGNKTWYNLTVLNPNAPEQEHEDTKEEEII